MIIRPDEYEILQLFSILTKHLPWYLFQSIMLIFDDVIIKAMIFELCTWHEGIRKSTFRIYITVTSFVDAKYIYKCIKDWYLMFRHNFQLNPIYIHISFNSLFISVTRKHVLDVWTFLMKVNYQTTREKFTPWGNQSLPNILIIYH